MKEFVKSYGVMLVFVAQWGWFAVEWWFRKSLVTKEDLAKVNVRVSETIRQNEDLGRRLEAIETARADAPSKNDIMKLRLEMERARGSMNTCTAKMEAAKEMSAAQLAAQQALITRSEAMVQTLTEHLLNHHDR